MSIDILYVTHNRRAFTEASFAALRENTNWDLVGRLLIRDDNSTDGTLELLHEQSRHMPMPVSLFSKKFGGPVAAMNDALDASRADVIAKIDNDLIVCPGWLDEMWYVLDNTRTIDVLGMEPGFGGPVESWVRWSGLPPRGAKHASHVGGLGLFRTRIFSLRRPRPDKRFFGWTQFQKRYADCAWITPDLPIFLLDHIDLEPWKTYAADYIEKGWSRAWNNYFTAGPEYYGWWLRDQVAVA